MLCAALLCSPRCAAARQAAGKNKKRASPRRRDVDANVDESTGGEDEFDEAEEAYPLEEKAVRVRERNAGVEDVPSGEDAENEGSGSIMDLVMQESEADQQQRAEEMSEMEEDNLDNDFTLEEEDEAEPAARRPHGTRLESQLAFSQESDKERELLSSQEVIEQKGNTTSQIAPPHLLLPALRKRSSSPLCAACCHLLHDHSGRSAPQQDGHHERGGAQADGGG